MVDVRVSLGCGGQQEAGKDGCREVRVSSRPEQAKSSWLSLIHSLYKKKRKPSVESGTFLSCKYFASMLHSHPVTLNTSCLLMRNFRRKGICAPLVDLLSSRQAGNCNEAREQGAINAVRLSRLIPRWSRCSIHATGTTHAACRSTGDDSVAECSPPDRQVAKLPMDRQVNAGTVRSADRRQRDRFGQGTEW